MSVNSYLCLLASELVLSGNEKNSITTSIETLKRRLGSYFAQEEIKDNFIFGSYTRFTILPRKFDDESDIDFMIVFDLRLLQKSFRFDSFSRHLQKNTDVNEPSDRPCA